ncbi:MAG: hypothetical protein HY823_04085 [Acidobacteria bacterium]|nr:hypothetical protein [Acidobacteriota bacterium]
MTIGTRLRGWATAAALIVASSCGGGGSSGGSASGSPPSTGTPGSLSRFAIVGDRLYTVGKSELQSFDIRRPWDPVKKGIAWVGWNIETLGGHENLLLIGSSDGLYIFDTANPDQPQRRGRLLHATARDPVVAQGGTAYLTLSGTINQLDVIDIQDPSAPRLLRSYPMRRPQGLGLDGKHLFLCDGEDGLKVFDATDPMDLKQVDRVPGLLPRDLIAADQLLVTTTQIGVFQYSYASLPLRFLSQLGYRR